MTSGSIDLLPATYETFTAAIAGDAELARLLGCAVAPQWTDFVGALPYLRKPYAEGAGALQWGSSFFMVNAPLTLVGIGGFKGAPSAEGFVEVGYSLAPAYRGRGLATSAVRELIVRAFAAPEVHAVDATTLAEGNPSTRVLERIGFVRIGTREEHEVGPLWQWRLTRSLAVQSRQHDAWPRSDDPSASNRASG